MNYILKRMEKASDKKLAEINKIHKIHKLHKIHDTMAIKAILKRARKNLKGIK